MAIEKLFGAETTTRKKKRLKTRSQGETICFAMLSARSVVGCVFAFHLLAPPKPQPFFSIPFVLDQKQAESNLS
jgi:hypothetical protein